MFRNAQEQAVVRAAKAWGFLQPEGVEQVAAYRRGFGGDEPWCDAAVRAGVLTREDQRALDRALAQASFGCDRCAVELQFAQLIALPQLVCAGCGGGLEPRGLPQEPPRPGRTEPSSAGSVEATSGNTLGPYTVLEEIGRGSMGVVYLAQRAGLERKFALKVLNAKYLDEEAIARFRLEAQVASKLEDPGVVGVFDIGRDGARYYYAMEHCVGETLADRIKTRGRIEPQEVAGLLEQVARTAHYAHERGVIHRDLKPANVIIDQTGRPRITDFGLARDWSLAKGLTRSGEVLGTPYYMAPEQVRGNEIDRRIDVYAMGVMLYESLTGRRPFEGRDATELFHKIQSDRPPSLRSLNPDVPEGLATIVNVAMSRKRADRYLTAEAMAEDLASFTRGEEPSHASGITAGESRDPGKAAVWLTAGVCVGLFGLIGWQMWKDRATPTGPIAVEASQPSASQSDLERALAKARALGSAREDVDRIRAEYQKVIDAAAGPDRVTATLALAAFLLRRGRWQDARDTVRDHVGAQSATGLEALRIRAESLYSEGRRKQAAAVYGELAAADPAGVRGLTAAAARWRIESRRTPEASQAARSAVALDRTYLPAVVEFVFHALATGDPHEAGDLLEEALTACPDHPRLLFMDGLRSVMAKRVEFGLKRIDDAIALTEPTPEGSILRLKGITLAQLKRFPEAIRAFDRAQERLPTVEGHLQRGQAYWSWAKKDWTDRRLQARALEDWRAAYKLDPRRFEAMLKGLPPQLQSEMRGASRPGGDTGQVGVVSSALRRRLESRAALAQKPARQLLRDALVRAASGDAWKAVFPLFARARKAAPRCRVVAEEVARVLIERDAYSEAFRAIERARDLGTPSEVLDLWTGEVWWRLGKRHKAAPIYERLAAKDPRGLLGLSARAQFYMAHEDEEKAQAAVDRALKLDPNHVPSLMVKAILTVAKSPRLVKEAHALTTQAITQVGSSDGRLVLLRLQCMEISAIFDLKRGRPRRRLGPRHVKPIFAAYEHAFDLVAGPSAHLNAVSFALMIPGKHPWADKVEGWLQEAIRRQPERGGTYVQLGRHYLVNGDSQEKILEAWRKAVQVEPRILFPPYYMDAYRKRFKGPAPELDEFKDRLGKDR